MATDRGVRELLLVVDVLHSVGSRLVQVIVVVGSRDPEVLPLLPTGPAQKLTSHRCVRQTAGAEFM